MATMMPMLTDMLPATHELGAYIIVRTRPTDCVLREEFVRVCNEEDRHLSVSCEQKISIDPHRVPNL